MAIHTAHRIAPALRSSGGGHENWWLLASLAFAEQSGSHCSLAHSQTDAHIHRSCSRLPIRMPLESEQPATGRALRSPR